MNLQLCALAILILLQATAQAVESEISMTASVYSGLRNEKLDTKEFADSNKCFGNILAELAKLSGQIKTNPELAALSKQYGPIEVMVGYFTESPSVEVKQNEKILHLDSNWGMRVRLKRDRLSEIGSLKFKDFKTEFVDPNSAGIIADLTNRDESKLLKEVCKYDGGIDPITNQVNPLRGGNVKCDSNQVSSRSAIYEHPANLQQCTSSVAEVWKKMTEQFKSADFVKNFASTPARSLEIIEGGKKTGRKKPSQAGEKTLPAGDGRTITKIGGKIGGSVGVSAELTFEIAR